MKLTMLLAAALLGWVAFFFRDPERPATLPADGWLISPADGRVMAVEACPETPDTPA